MKDKHPINQNTERRMLVTLFDERWRVNERLRTIKESVKPTPSKGNGRQ